MNRLTVPALVAALAWGCGGGSSGSTTATAPPAAEARAGGQTVSANLRDALLHKHNAKFFGNRTFRWIPPVPTFLLLDDPELQDVLFNEALVWEGIVGQPLLEAQFISPDIPARGIFLTFAELPGDVIGRGDPFVFAEVRRGSGRLGPRLRQLKLRATRRVEAPEILASGEIQRCEMTLDPELLDADDLTIRWTLRHEVGHCLGFIDHVKSGLMRPTCCNLTVTSDLRSVMRKLYRLPPGTSVTR